MTQRSTQDDAALLAWAAGLIRDMQDKNGHGSVRVEFKAGRIVTARVEETVLPRDVS